MSAGTWSGSSAASARPARSGVSEKYSCLSPPRPRNSCATHLERNCEGDGDVVGVATPLVRGGAKVLPGDQVVELSVQLEVQEREEKGEDGEGQVEVEEERGELKEKRTCTWMT